MQYSRLGASLAARNGIKRRPTALLEFLQAVGARTNRLNSITFASPRYLSGPTVGRKCRQGNSISSFVVFPCSADVPQLLPPRRRFNVTERGTCRVCAGGLSDPIFQLQVNTDNRDCFPGSYQFWAGGPPRSRTNDDNPTFRTG